MNRQEFDGEWPDHLEGEAFSNKSRIKFIREQRGNRATSMWGWLIGLAIIGIARFFEVSWNTIEIAVAFVLLASIYAECASIRGDLEQILVEIELLKGSIRASRFVSAHQHKISMDVAGRDEYGHRLDD